MQPDKLEEFILENREQFDTAEPSPEIWKRVRRRPAPVLGIGWRGLAWRAAAAVLIFFSSYIFFRLTDRDPAPPSGESIGMIREEQSPLVQDLKEAEIYYSAQIEFSRAEAIRLSDGDPAVQDLIDTQMVDLDKIYEELRRDLQDNTANEAVIEAMIQNYRIKLEVLEEILRQIRQLKEPANNASHENEVIAL